MSNESEAAANAALKEALQALQRAGELCERAGYGNVLLGRIFDAQRDTRYALDLALGRS